MNQYVIDASTNSWKLNWNNGNTNNNNRNNNNYVRAFREYLKNINIVELEDILEAYLDCRKNKRNSKAALKFELNYVQECLDLVEKINNRTYLIGPSIAFIVTKPKKREIFAADFRDRVVHHWLILRLEPLFEKILIQDTYNCRKGKGTLYGIKRLESKIKTISCNYTKTCYVSKFDMLGFFMHIYKPLLWKMLKSFIKERYKGKDIDDVLYITEKIVMHCPENNCIIKGSINSWKDIPLDKSLFTCGKYFGLPIGNITSQMFANFYLHIFDDIMYETFKEGYGRYVDDFFIISCDKLRILKNINFVRELLDKYKIPLHPNKIYLLECKKGIKFIGSVVKPNRIYTGNRTIGNFKLLINEINNHHEYDLETVVCRINSYLGFLCHTRSYKLRTKLILELDNYWKSLLKIRKDFNAVIIKK